MPLDFGGMENVFFNSQRFNQGAAFATTNLTFDEITSDGTAATDAFSETNLSSVSWEPINDASVTVFVPEGRRVFVIVTCQADSDTNGEELDIRIRRDSAVTVADNKADPDTIAPEMPLAIAKIDEPGEGYHTYTVEGMSTDGTGDFWNGYLTALVI